MKIDIQSLKNERLKEMSLYLNYNLDNFFDILEYYDKKDSFDNHKFLEDISIFLEKIYQDGCDDGYEEGYDDGYEEGYNENDNA